MALEEDSANAKCTCELWIAEMETSVNELAKIEDEFAAVVGDNVHSNGEAGKRLTQQHPPFPLFLSALQCLQ